MSSTLPRGMAAPDSALVAVPLAAPEFAPHPDVTTSGRGDIRGHRRRRNDWAIGPITGHRVTVVGWMVALTTGLYVFQSIVWPRGGVALHGALGHFITVAQIVWLVSLPVGLFGLIGALAFRHPEHLPEVRPIEQQVSFRIVSRGTNIEALSSSIQRCLAEMAAHPLFDFVVEVVVEEGCRSELLPRDPRVHLLEVPATYETPNGSLFKARALQFALDASEIPPGAWIVHLDEETQPTASGISGIAEMIAEEEVSQRLRVGQGAILYHRNWKRHPILTLADMHRTGDDLARFHLQHRLGITLFGLHGSFIVVRNDIEKQIGFDFGPVGSITEDAFWALSFMESGGRSRWVHGYLEEQSTQGWRDFIKQRKRWFQGLVLVGLHAPTALRWRLPLLTFTLLWGVAPLAVIYTTVNAVLGFSVNGTVRILADISFATLLTLYVVGLRTNLNEADIDNPFERFGWLVLQLLLAPFFGVAEALGVVEGMLAPVGGFHVVRK